MNMPTLASAAIIVFAAAATVQAQTRPVFEAASVKVNTSGDGGSSSNGSRGQVVMSNQTLKRLVERAYNVKPFQVIAPAWLEDLRFDIAAKYPPDMKNDDGPAMLRALLEDRFKLVAHRESKTLPGYALVVTKGGFKLTPAQPGPGGTESNGNGRVEDFTAKKATMEMLADALSRYVDTRIIDDTGIAGIYAVQLHWSVDDPEAKFAAIQDALSVVGLRLRAQKVPTGMIVVDHVERTPTEN